MKKKLFLGLFLLIAFLSVTIKVEAKEIYDDDQINYILENADQNDIYLENGKLIYSDEYQKILSIKNEQLEKSYQKYLNTKKYNISDSDKSLKLFNIGDSINGFCYTSRTLGVPTYQQEQNYYCGPASVKETLHFINGSSLSQSQYASDMGTNTSGTYVYQIRNELNNKQSAHTYTYEDISTVSRFNQIVIADILDSDVGVPFIIHALTGSLYMYNGTTIHHYLVVNGANQTTQKVTYIDSWAYDYGRGTTLGQHTDTRSNVANTVTSSGRFVIW